MELLVRIAEKKYPDGSTSEEFLEVGDVVAIGRNGHDWTEKERSNPDWAIIKVPAMTAAQAEIFLSRQAPPDLDNEYVLRKRASRIDLIKIGKKATYTLKNIIDALVTKSPPRRRVNSIVPDKGRIG